MPESRLPADNPAVLLGVVTTPPVLPQERTELVGQLHRDDAPRADEYPPEEDLIPHAASLRVVLVAIGR